jgi:hypothetical protein
MFQQASFFLNIDTVSYGCVRQWVLRLALGLLNEPVEKRTDWIYIVDFSVHLGKERCWLILGVTKQTLEEHGYELGHKQVRVLDIYVQKHFDAKSVEDRLLITKEKTGTPYQIISDKGHDVCKGIELFCGENNEVIPTYDITHMIGIVLKHHLKNDPRWLCLQEDLLSLTQQVKQTELSFLRPIALSKKARWLNIKQEIQYLEDIYEFEIKSDFSLVSRDYKIENNEEIFEMLKNNCENSVEEKRLARELKAKTFTDKNSVAQWLNKTGIIEIDNIKLTDAGKSRYREKFNILDKHEEYFSELKQLNYVAESIKNIVRKRGLSLDTLQEIEMLYNAITYKSVFQIFNEINNNLQIEHSKCGIEKAPLLCCSEIIESVFGKFKAKSKQTVGGIYQSVLSIALICNDLTPEKITKYLSQVRTSDVEDWYFSMNGTSNLTKRKKAFG